MGTLRIIAGSLRGRRIPVPERAALRPTPERVREALFSILGDRVLDARVLDAFAGTGTLGLEALSRGAAEVWFLESDPRVARAIERSSVDLGVVDRCHVLTGRVIPLLASGVVAGGLDLVIADPPYDAGEGRRLLELVGSSGLLAPDGLLVLERSARSPEDPQRPPAGLEFSRLARYGDTRLEFYQPAAENPRADGPESGPGEPPATPGGGGG